jgi:tetratricopeptide (TPR) repeat protein
MNSGEHEKALAEARLWRKHDAYNLVAVRVLGDLLTELGQEQQALRTYSAVTELLAEDPSAQRSLASVLKQQGRLEAAGERLERAVELQPEDARLRLELADIQLRTGHEEESRAALEALVAEDELPQELRHPTRSRLGQLYATRKRAAANAGDSATADYWHQKLTALEIAGGADNDIRVYLSWDTDRSDVDLWVTTPGGEKIFYSHKKGRRGEALYHDITSGYGPESFTVPTTEAGAYRIEVNYFSSGRSGFPEARGEVTVVLHEGRANEEVHRLPYRLHRVKETLHVATVEVGS